MSESDWRARRKLVNQIATLNQQMFKKMDEIKSRYSTEILRLRDEESKYYDGWFKYERYKEQVRKDSMLDVFNRKIDWALNHLKSGDEIKMSGTRDGYGRRKVLTIDNNGDAVLTIMAPQQTGKTVSYIETLHTTTQNIGKITEAKIDGKWVSIKDLI